MTTMDNVLESAIKATESGKLRWSHQGYGLRFYAMVSGLKLDLAASEAVIPHDIKLSVCDSIGRGMELDSISYGDNVAVTDNCKERLKHLMDIVRRQALETDKKLKEIVRSLGEQ